MCDDPSCPLHGFEAVKQTNKRLEINCKWLLGNLDEIHACLCPGKTGTWQMRVEQAVEAAKTVKEKEFSKGYTIGKRKGFNSGRKY